MRQKSRSSGHQTNQRAAGSRSSACVSYAICEPYDPLHSESYNLLFTRMVERCLALKAFLTGDDQGLPDW